ncbi:class i nuclease-like protein [Leishmania major strain Friedlin]|uniref:Class i nuclease-like protein n=1 Tax=Leishmania major TaxID=5664 RepID=Q4Q7F7_LEIMA|nr:class i nuclease-like protein [Leishmania major strain Friedlin]CAG9578346.1 p1/s1_nuclease [Leishmania major strain Friedlin]CAG9578348.1 p1/s1_nuclease [Leishmania major strain Friedlin]CAJ06237.1 class i nuclease-like protein [Leishmania major strain Friedlin]|eukprot:XP_001684741.1 class i nuclease-like protein [Leishmania major strain Friedlin]
MGRGERCLLPLALHSAYVLFRALCRFMRICVAIVFIPTYIYIYMYVYIYISCFYFHICFSAYDFVCLRCGGLFRHLFALAATADRLLETYTFPEALRTLVDVVAIHEESHMFAVNTSYPGVTPGATLSDAYLARCKRVAEARLTLGGYRLGYLLNELLPSIPVDEATLEAYRAARWKRSA